MKHLSERKYELAYRLLTEQAQEYVSLEGFKVHQQQRSSQERKIEGRPVFVSDGPRLFAACDFVTSGDARSPVSVHLLKESSGWRIAHVGTLLMKADEAVRSSDNRTAVEFLLQATSIDTISSFVWRKLSTVYGNLAVDEKRPETYSAKASSCAARADAEAVRYEISAAEQGMADHQFRLGALYATGTLVAKSPAEAVRWYHKAAEQGLADAQGALGVAYMEGGGVARNDGEAIMWFRKAAAQGDQDARALLENLDPEGELINAASLLLETRKRAHDMEYELRYKTLSHEMQGKLVVLQQYTLNTLQPAISRFYWLLAKYSVKHDAMALRDLAIKHGFLELVER